MNGNMIVLVCYGLIVLISGSALAKEIINYYQNVRENEERLSEYRERTWKNFTKKLGK